MIHNTFAPGGWTENKYQIMIRLGQNATENNHIICNQSLNLNGKKIEY